MRIILAMLKLQLFITFPTQDSRSNKRNILKPD